MPRPLRILIAPDAFKECMTAREAAEAIERGAKKAPLRSHQRVMLRYAAVSDGGAGLPAVFVSHRGFATRRAQVHDSLGTPIEAAFAIGHEPRRISTANWAWVAWGIGIGWPCLYATFILSLGLSRPAIESLGWFVLVGPVVALALFVVQATRRHRRLRAEPRSLVAVGSAAAAPGLALVRDRPRDPTTASTFGVGELILSMLDAGAARIVLGIGNTATCDGGVGMLAALGVRFFDRTGSLIRLPVGADFARIARVDAAGLDARIARTSLVAACDVDNPLFGPEGAAHVFAPQKGATAAQIKELDDGLRRLTQLFDEAGIPPDPDAIGSGAGGGLGFALMSVCHARHERGVDLALEHGPFFERLLRDDPGSGLLASTRLSFEVANLVLTGAGRLDATDLRGKAVLGVSKAAARANVPTIALVGSVGPGADDCLATRPDGSPGLDGGLHAYHVITPPGMPLDEALRRGPELLEATAERVVREWVLTRRV